MLKKEIILCVFIIYFDYGNKGFKLEYYFILLLFE